MPIPLESVAEEQPQQNDHRYRHAQQPKQNASSHHLLHKKSYGFNNAKRRSRFRRGGTVKPFTSVRCSASTSTAPPAAWHRPFAAARSNADPASGRMPSGHRAAGG